MTNTAPLGGDVPEWTLGDRLRKARESAGDTQQQLANRLDISLRIVKEGEADKRRPKRAIILGWAVACGVSPRWLENDDQKGEPNTDGVTIGYQVNDDDVVCEFPANVYPIFQAACR